MEKLYRPQKKSPVPTPVLKSHKSPNENLIFAPSQSKKRLVKSKNPSYTASPVETPKGSNLNMGQKQFLNFKPLHVRQNSESQVKMYEKFDKLTSANKQENSSKIKNTTKTNQIARKLTMQNPLALPRPPTTKKHQTKESAKQKDQEIQSSQQKKDSSKTIQHNRVNSYNGINGITATINPVLSSRRQSRQNSSSQLRLSQDLNVVQGVSYKSKTGMIPGSVPKVNQDSYIVQNFFSKSLTQHFYAVADGHGICGHDVSQYVKARLPAILQNEQDLKGNPAKALRNSILQVSNELMRQQFDVQFSGTTLVSVLVQGRKLWCANVGDSRAVLVKENSAIPLNRDHKPELEDEAQRIYDCNGRIMAYKDEDGSDIGPLRV